MSTGKLPPTYRRKVMPSHPVSFGLPDPEDEDIASLRKGSTYITDLELQRHNISHVSVTVYM